MKGKSPQGSRVTVKIEEYLLCSSAQLTSFSSPAARASRLTSSMLPHASLGASQLLKPASTTPRNYGRRHRSWHNGHVHATHNERRRGKRPVHHDQVHSWRRGHRLGTTTKHLRRTRSGAAGNRLGATMKYLRRTTSAAANNGLGTTAIPPL